MRFQFLRRKRDAQSFGNLARHFVLHFKDVFHLAIEAFRPQWKIGVRVDQLRVDAQTSSGAPQRAGQHVRGAELLANLRGRHRFVAESQTPSVAKKCSARGFSRAR